MRNSHLFQGFILFLLLSASITHGQTISSQNGLTTAVFTTANGTIKVYLPDDIRQGDVISGRVVAEPDGRNEKQIARNLAELIKYAIRLNGEKFTVESAAKTFRTMAQPGQLLQSSLQLMNAGGTNPVQQLTIPSKPVSEQQPAPAQCIIPGHVLTGSPMTVPGPFDGNAANTQCTIGGQPATILAESPRACIAAFPENANGIQPTAIKENGQQPCTKNVSGVEMNVSAGRLSLQKGEKTYIDVKITGLQNLQNPAMLTLNNLTTDVVVLQPSNMITVPLLRDSVQSGTFNRRFDVQSLRSGNFAVNVNLDFGDVMLSPGDVLMEPGGDALNPGLVVVQGKDCKCSVKASVSVFKVENDIVTYMAMPYAGCSGDKCLYKNDLKFNWQILSGNNNAEIIQTNESGFEIKVRRKNGAYTIKNTATVTCSDGTSCSDDIVINADGSEVPGVAGGEKAKPPVPVDPGPPKTPTVDTTTDGNKICPRTIVGIKAPAISGGLRLDKFMLDEIPFEIPRASTIHRDDFVPLSAYGNDRDMLKVLCTPVKPPCQDGASELLVPINGRVKFTWEILNKQGRFVKLGCLYSNGLSDQTTEGDQVIFMPPIVPLPIDKDIQITTKIKLTISDARGSNDEEAKKIPAGDEEKKLTGELMDDPLVRTFNIITTRGKADPDNYHIQIEYSEAATAAIPGLSSKTGSCQAGVGKWEKSTDLKQPVIKLPAVADNNKLVMGQLIVLEATNQAETDVLPGIVCVSAGGCKTPGPASMTFEDNIQWRWTASGGPGKLIVGIHGRFVVYMAPNDFPEGVNEMVITITVEAFNPGFGMIPDAVVKSEPINLTIYRAGIALQHPPPEFTPTDKNSVKLVSELKYFRDGIWQPAMEHMCRIHHFELVKVSAEKGICMNDPVPIKGNECADFFFKTDANQEGYAPQDISSKCKMKDIFLKARSQKPEKNFTVEISSQDYGSYGLVRSFVGDKLKLFDHLKYYAYDPIPWKDADVPHIHPERRKKHEDYTDNRVTIPLDIDENQIPDAGYLNQQGDLLPDPPGGKADTTDKQPKGDGVNGDGLTDYEEYRGFMYRKSVSKKEGESIAAMPEDMHVRSDYRIKTIFIHNQNNLDISLYRTVSELEVFEIAKLNYSADHVVNFNSNPNTNVVAQKGLYLRDGGAGGKLLGIARSTTGKPAPPNDQIEIIIYTKSVEEHIKRVKDSVDKFNKTLETMKKLEKGVSYKYMDPVAKMRQVIAHELLHGNNVSHHGEGDEKLDVSHDKMNGLRSGNIDCVMRYDNTGTKIKSYRYYPEIPGTILCDSPLGTSYNTPKDVEIPDGEKILIKSVDRGYGNCATDRGNCQAQIHITGAVPPPNTGGKKD